MNDSQGRITVLHRIHNDPHRKKVIDLVDGLILIFHFFVDTEKVLHPPVNLGLNAGIYNMHPHLVHNPLNVSFPLTFARGDLIHQIIISLRLRIFQG